MYGYIYFVERFHVVGFDWCIFLEVCYNSYRVLKMVISHVTTNAQGKCPLINFIKERNKETQDKIHPII
jgi:hypothetical protein